MDRKLSLGIGWIAVSLLFGGFVPFAWAEELVIVNESVTADSVDARTLERVFLGRTTRIANEPVSIGVLREGVTHANFLTNYVGRKPAQFLSHWRMICFTGKGDLPQQFRSETDVVAWVAETRGAIAYIDRATPHEGVKVLVVR